MSSNMKSGEIEKTDFLIFGSGVASLRCAISLAPAGKVLVLTKQPLPGQPCKHANGIIAIASNDEVEIRLHYEDTVCAGEGLCKPEAVKVLVEEGPKYIEELISWGAEFQRECSKTAANKENVKQPRPYTYRGRSRSTVNEILTVLEKQVASNPNIKILPETYVEDLIIHDGRVAGAHFFDMKAGRRHTACATAAMIGTGGMGQVYPQTTNSEFCTGDGLAIAYRAGAQLADMEFIQFHPTVLHMRNAPRILIPESLRAEGAYLRNADLDRFMHRYHPQEEMAPRDLLSRAIMMEMQRTQSGFVYLDCTHLDVDLLSKRFPTMCAAFIEFNIDISENMIPIHPAAHYCIGGVKIDTRGRTSLPGLYAAGEASCSGVHGSNRLPSNSLLESLVFGARAGHAMIEDRESFQPGPRSNGQLERSTNSGSSRSCHPDEIMARLRKLMVENAGIIRSGHLLRFALDSLQHLSTEVNSSDTLRHDPRLGNLLSVSQIVAASALAREESRGAHYREDFPLRNDQRFLKHSVISINNPVTFSD